MEKYNISPKIIGGRVYCNSKTDEQIAKMNIDQRYKEDNRIVTWTKGVVNFGFDQKFIHNGMIINDTDNRSQDILKDTDIIGNRNITNNGNWFV